MSLSTRFRSNSGQCFFCNREYDNTLYCCLTQHMPVVWYSTWYSGNKLTSFWIPLTFIMLSIHQGSGSFYYQFEIFGLILPGIEPGISKNQIEWSTIRLPLLSWYWYIDSSFEFYCPITEVYIYIKEWNHWCLHLNKGMKSCDVFI